MKRRHFLQTAGSTLAAIGLSQADFLRQVDRYGRVLAQGTPRKLALLVGINRYPDPIPDLPGCLNDVELQSELLVNRFGFNPQDIIKISDTEPLKPDRATILKVFKEHLIDQARPGDVVVFHYSGHGSKIKDPNPIAPDPGDGDSYLNGTIVPNDASVEVDLTGTELAVPDIMGRTLFLLMHAIQTENLTVVLDSCYSGAGTRGNVTVRSIGANRLSRSSGLPLVPSAAELEYQKQWMADLKLSDDDFQKGRKAGIARGVAIGSALRTQAALDIDFGGFNAGAFTYLLTRYLWQLPTHQSTATVYSNLELSTRITTRLDSDDRGQVPVFQYKPDSNNDQKPLYFLEMATPAAEAVIQRKLEGDLIEFWLGGVSSHNLRAMGAGTIYTLLNSDGRSLGQIQQVRREGLRGYGRLMAGETATVQPGQLLREKVVGIPDHPVLKVGLDPSLEEDGAAARSALGQVARVEIAELPDADCLLGRMTAHYQEQLTTAGMTNLPPVGSIGLLQPDLTPIANSFDSTGDLETAIVRLRPRFKTLLANQILQQVLQGRSSDLRVTAEITAKEPAGKMSRTIVATRAAREASNRAIDTAPLQVPSDTVLQITVNNQEDQDLYLSVLVVSSDGAITALYPPVMDAPDDAARIDRGRSLTVPRLEDGKEFFISGTSGTPELLMLVSKQPLRTALTAIQTIGRGQGGTRGDFVGLSEDSLFILDDILTDADDQTRSGAPSTARSRQPGERRLDASMLAVLSCVIQVNGSELCS
ncbi:caspase family protein [Leptolyngbya ohadii]|uniref:caspase family protein n=1 Tax=Leptolyngbya ohadii TaxID=1962290 RepID=UPI000B5A0F41|nr:caspase family protein [Leptolyngbya ohadii]